TAAFSDALPRPTEVIIQLPLSVTANSSSAEATRESLILMAFKNSEILRLLTWSPTKVWSPNPPRLRANLLKAFFDKRRILDPRQLRVQPIFVEQLFVCAALDDFSMAEHEDLIGISNRAETMRDDKAGAPGHEPFQSFLDQTLSGCIDAGGGFIQNENRC